MDVRSYLIIAILFSYSFIFAQTADQTIYGKVSYRCMRDSALFQRFLDTMKLENPDQYKFMLRSYQNWETLIPNFQFELTFNANESLSQMVEEAKPIDGISDLDFFSAVSLVNGDKRFHLNIRDTVRLYEHSLDKGVSVVHITEPYKKFGWKITGNTKMIGSYPCREALGSITKESMCCGKVTIPITAWFAPSLPFPFGPMGYDGLPGLVLEVRVDTKYNTTFYAVDIDIRRGVDKPIPKLKKPSKVMTTEKFNDFATERVNRIKN